MDRSIWIGFDPREAASFAVARASIRQFDRITPIRGVVMEELKASKLYTRPTERRLGKLWDGISGKYMSTEFAITRFLVPTLAKTGWALFCDCDVLFRENPARLFDLANSKYAVMCVKHDYDPGAVLKMDEQRQYSYPRKNWSSVMLFNCQHPANKKLTPELVNSLPGLNLHQYCWLEDNEIGELPVEWNWLVGHSSEDVTPKLVHFTDGGPWFESFANVPYANEWRRELHRWAA